MSYGSRSYPFEQGFDSQGRIVGLTNWAAFNTMSGARATTWLYHTERGWLTNKLYAGDTNGVRYTYSPAGRLNSRLWARGITTAYSPTAAGDVERIEYSDGITLNITNTYDRVGRLSQVKQGTNTTTFDYDSEGRMYNETFNGVSVTSGFDAAGRKNSMVMMAGASSNVVTYFYDTANRLRDVTNGTYNVRYSYFGNSRLVSSAAFRNNANTRMTTSRTYDRVNRLLSISSSGTGMVLPESYAYDYNSASQRVKTTLADGSYWVYKYDSMGQLTSGKKYWADGTAVPGQQFEYGYDDIGNRTSTKEGGDQNGDGFRASSYSATALNQYSSRTNAPGIDILGVANPLATVTVSNQSAYRKGEYFQKALVINNAGGAQYPLVTNIATLSGVTNIEWGKIYVPPATESYVHDQDGNLTQDARWNYTWDAENRLINQEARNGSDPTASIVHGYDYRSRRISIKITETGGGLSTNRFIYNGWNVIAEFNGGGVLQKSFVWGKDLSGSEQGAGGVGGLVMLVIHTNGTTGTYFPAYDGNGNLTALWKGSESSSGIKARYEYDPFHNVLRATGDIAKENNHLAATKYYSWQSGQYYYGFRHYDPDTGRWLSNDPIGERGGFNLYMVNHNNPMNKADFLGLAVNMWHSVSISCPKSCGLDYTAAVNAELSALNAYLSSAPKFPVNRNHLEIGGLFPSPEEDRQFQEYARYNSAFYAWFQEVARSLDYDKQARLAASGATPFGSCPSSACRNSITLCGQCVGDDVPGNILFGYLAAATGIRDSVRNLGAHAAESTDRDGEGPLDQDVDVFPLGKQLFQNNKLDVCTVLKALPVHATQSCTPCSKNGSFGRPTPFLSVQYPKY